ncbi:MFS transporter [Rossellomorea vietnamensis]|uniref:MFS transporter n=1 Tax=Rossellomorea vietnamensis TaxID=218284 RepID=A0ACD4CDS9_9BACI|nr:MFS transporter [Rossellomorea vietnamensis]UXH46657.1 MFS transporter [Rossellomorea vietnamensis]
MKKWKDPLLLLSGIGISSIGGWIYLIALNLIVLDEWGSPVAVVMLYVLKPLAALITNGWAGSLIDRVNKRNLMAALDFFRAVLIAMLPFVSAEWWMYAVVLFINMGSAVFYPASMAYITTLIPSGNRQRFNALRGLIGSGAFLIGPGVAGLMFLMGTPTFALYINALALLLSGVITLFLPKLADGDPAHISGINWEMVKGDWRVVWGFSKKASYVMILYVLFTCMLVMTAVIDSLEAAFSKDVLHLSNSTYGYLVSIAGGGFVLGSLLNAAFSHKFHHMHLMGVGSVIVSIGYIVYAFSHGFLTIAIGFALLSFALAFATTGFETFYQEHIPVEIMGRVGSLYGLLEGVLVILLTVLIGLGAEVVSIRAAVAGGSIVMLGVTLVLWGAMRKNSWKKQLNYNSECYNK